MASKGGTSKYCCVGLFAVSCGNAIIWGNTSEPIRVDSGEEINIPE